MNNKEVFTSRHRHGVLSPGSRAAGSSCINNRKCLPPDTDTVYFHLDPELLEVHV